MILAQRRLFGIDLEYMQMGEAAVSEASDIRQTVKVLSRISTLRAIYHITEVWAVIGLAVWLSGWVLPLSSGAWGLCVYLGAVAIIASRQHALMVLVHEAIHKRVSRTVWLNNNVTRLTAAFPIFISLSKWRFIHLYHHQYTYTKDDPDRAIYARYPLGSRKFRLLLLRDVCGLNVISTLKYFIDLPFVTRTFNEKFLGEAGAERYRQTADMRLFMIFWGAVLISGFAFGGLAFGKLLVLYWLIPYCTLTQVFFRIRGAIEHGNVPDPENPYQQTRTYFIPPALSFFFAPKQVNYHLEHHLYPSIPFYNLPRMHAALQSVYEQELGYCEPFGTSLQKLAHG